MAIPHLGEMSRITAEDKCWKISSEMDQCILNDGSATCIQPATGSTSALDLSICAPSLGLDYMWKICEDLCGSDHFPVILTSDTVDSTPNR